MDPDTDRHESSDPKIAITLSIHQSLSDRIRALAEADERSLSWIAEKLMLAGLEATAGRVQP